MRDLLQDLRYAARLLWKYPGSTAAAVLILALGIGANTTIFGVINALMFRPLPYKDAERIVYILSGKKHAANWGACSAADFEDWKKDNHVFQEMALIGPDHVNLAGGGEPERVAAAWVSRDMPPLFGLAAAAGRVFGREAFRPGGESAVMVSHGCWQRRFGSSADAIGRTVFVNGTPHTVIGVLPSGFRLALVTGTEPDLLLPLSPNPSESRSLRRFVACGRLKDGVSLERARADMSLISRRLAQQYPGSNSGWTAWVDTLRGTVDPAAYVLLVVLICSVLGIACTNVTNLLLARAAGRRREMSIRASLGAGRARILRQLMTESLLLAFLGCCLGILISVWACSAITAFTSGTNAGLLDVRVDLRVLGFSVLLFVGTGFAIGLLPGLDASRSDLSAPLKEETLLAPPSRRRLGNALVMSEIAVSLVLLAAAGLVIKSWISLWQVDLGFRPQGLVTASIALSETEYAGEMRKAAFFDQLLGRLNGRPDIHSASVMSALPTASHTLPFTITGRPKPAAGEEPSARFSSISPGCFATLGMKLLAGRSFAQADMANSAQVAIVNEAMARQHWAGQSPLGAEIQAGGRSRMIIGVVADVRSVPLSMKPFPEIYVPFTQVPAGKAALIVRSGHPNLPAVAALLKDEIHSLDPNLPASGVRLVQDAISANLGVIRVGTSLLAVLAAGALILATAGIYGVLSCTVAQRTGEIGIRMALGAGRAEVLKMVLGNGSKLTGFGVAAGLIGSLALGRLLSSRIHGLSPVEPAILAGAALLLVLVSLGACWFPAHRAAAMDPIRALRIGGQ